MQDTTVATEGGINTTQNTININLNTENVTNEEVEDNGFASIAEKLVEAKLITNTHAEKIARKIQLQNYIILRK